LDRTLRKNMTKKFDMVAIGTGSAASVAASRCCAAGWKVAVVDSRPFGGTCSLRGCDPKKILVGAAEAFDWAGRMEDMGIQAEKLQINWQELMRFKRSFTDPVPKRTEEALAKAGTAGFHGRARFIGPSAVQVGNEVLEARYFVVAVGQRPADLRIPGTQNLTMSDQFLDLDDLPKTIIFIGGGYIAFEFAHVAARVGAQVTVLHRGPCPLPLFDPELVDQIVKSTRGLGVDVQLGTEVVKVESQASQLLVRATVSGQERTFRADMVVHAAGRVPEIDDLNLDVAGVKWNKHGVTVNEFLQSVSNPAVYAAGDAAASGGPPLTPVASYDGAIVAANLLNGNHQKPTYWGIPTVVFTIPPLAAVGLGEIEARKQNLKFAVKKGMTSGCFSSRRVAEKYSGFKTLVEEDTDRILGAHICGSGSEELINLFGLAMQSGLRATDLKHMFFAYPTRGSDVSHML
jgi:glutathione reductase (NADPH)